MKNVLSLVLLLAPGFIFSQKAPLKFDRLVQKFEKTEAGIPVVLSYNFENISNSPVLINKAKVSCSCTSVDFPGDPIKPNSSGKIKVIFDTKGKIGFQEREVELITNQGSVVLIFKGVVRKIDN